MFYTAIISIFMLIGMVSVQANYDVSILYLKVVNNEKPYKIMLNGKSYHISEATAVIDGVVPGKYDIKITQAEKSYIDAKGNNNEYEKVIFVGQIDIVPKRAIYACIDTDHQLRILKQRTIKTT